MSPQIRFPRKRNDRQGKGGRPVGDHGSLRVACGTAERALIIGKDWKIGDVDRVLANARIRFSRLSYAKHHFVADLAKIVRTKRKQCLERNEVVDVDQVVDEVQSLAR